MTRRVSIEYWEEMKIKLKEKYLFDSYKNRLLEDKFDRLLSLIRDCSSLGRDCSSTIKMESRHESRHNKSVSSDNNDYSKVTEDVFLPRLVVIVKDTSVDSSTPMLDDVHAHEGDTSASEHEVVESGASIQFATPKLEDGIDIKTIDTSTVTSSKHSSPLVLIVVLWSFLLFHF